MNATWFFILSLIASVIIGLIILVIRDFKYYRGMVRKEFGEYINLNCPDMVFEEVGPKIIKAKYNGQLLIGDNFVIKMQMQV